MHHQRRPLLQAGIAPALLPLLLLTACGGGSAMESKRALSDFRVDQVPRIPGGLPQEWGSQFDAVMAEAPSLELGDARTPQVVQDLLSRVDWIDPKTIEVKVALPDGLRVSYRPKLPQLAIARGQRPVAAIAQDGTVLPAGLSAAAMEGLLFVSLDSDVDLPAAGKHCSDPLVQEAFRLWVEADTVADLTGLPIVEIQRRSEYPRHADGIAPAMSFILHDGTEICWGRARDTADPSAVDSLGKPLTIERKAMRLALILEQYPELQGVGRVDLDFPMVKVFDASLQRLPLDKPIP
ncbi:MAG: cell division protein FtsQ/DivIB [Planctomycetota bacterium]|jgi:hypothetical protein